MAAGGESAAPGKTPGDFSDHHAPRATRRADWAAYRRRRARRPI